MKFSMQDKFKFAAIIASIAFLSTRFDTFPFPKTILAAIAMASMLYYSNAQIAIEKAPSKQKETLSRTIVIPAFILLLLFFLFDLYAGKTNVFVSAAGIVLIMIGTFFYVKNAYFLGKFFSTFVEIKLGHKLVTTGLFATVRHPMYLCALLIYFGFALAANSLACTAITVFFFFPWTIWRIKLEEQMLAKEFGKEFEEYKKTTPAIIPKLF